MGFFGILLLIILIFLLIRVWPLIKVLHTARRQSREWQDLFRQAAGASAGQHRHRSDTRRTTATARKRKIFTREDGEYVDFEEIEVEQTTTYTSSARHSDVTPEPQVSDAEWEDIK